MYNKNHYRANIFLAKKRASNKFLNQSAFLILATIALLAIISPSFSANSAVEPNPPSFAQMQETWHGD